MDKLPNLTAARDHLAVARCLVRTVSCAATIDEALQAVERAIRLEHDAHLRDIRRNGT